MKVIDLLNKIAKGEIDYTTKFDAKVNMGYCGINEYFERYPINENYLNCEIELEDTPIEDKKIPEKLDYCEENTFMEQKETTYLSQEERRLLDSNFKELGNKINSIIDYLKSKGE